MSDYFVVYYVGTLKICGEHLGGTGSIDWRALVVTVSAAGASIEIVLARGGRRHGAHYSVRDWVLGRSGHRAVADRSATQRGLRWRRSVGASPTDLFFGCFRLDEIIKRWVDIDEVNQIC